MTDRISGVQNHLNTLFTAILAASAVAMTAMFAADRLGANPRVRIENERSWQSLDSADIHEGGIILGQASAHDTITVFSDYECPFCQALWWAIAASKSYQKGQLVVRFHDLPLERVHPHALVAAQAARCLASHPEFHILHNRLMRDASLASDLPVLTRDVSGVDLDTVRACISSAATLSGLERDIDVAHRHGFTGTPVLIAGRAYIVGAIGTRQVDSITTSRGQMR